MAREKGIYYQTKYILSILINIVATQYIGYTCKNISLQLNMYLFAIFDMFARKNIFARKYIFAKKIYTKNIFARKIIFARKNIFATKNIFARNNYII